MTTDKEEAEERIVDLLIGSKVAFYITTLNGGRFTMNPGKLKEIPLAILEDAYEVLNSEICRRDNDEMDKQREEEVSRYD